MAARGGASGNGNKGDASLWNLPNILTLMRVFAIPVLIAIFYQDVVRRHMCVCGWVGVNTYMWDWGENEVPTRMY